MTRRVAMRFGLVAGTRAGLGRAGPRTLVADRPDGVAGGQGLGFNGAELLAAALGGCLWNDLHYAADRLGVALGEVEVACEVALDGDPLRVVGATLRVRLGAADPGSARACFDEACAGSTIANSLLPALPVHFVLEDA